MVRVSKQSIRWLVLVSLSFRPGSLCANTLKSLLIQKKELPESCKMVSDLFASGPVGELYDYHSFGDTLPPLVRKAHQSFRCDRRSGSFLFWEYKTVLERSQAQTFAREYLRGSSDRPLILDAGTAMVVVSFNDPPWSLYGLLEKKTAKARAEAPPLEQKAFVESARPPEEVNSINAKKKTIDTLRADVAKRASDAEAATKKVLPPVLAYARPIDGPIGQLADVSDEFLTQLKKDLACFEPGKTGDFLEVCGWIESFMIGRRPTISPKSGFLFGRSFLIDANRRLVDVYYEGFFPVAADRTGRCQTKSTNALEDVDLRTLIQSARNQQSIPDSLVLKRMQQEASRQTFVLEPTKGQSLSWIDANKRRCFMRVSGNAHLMVCVHGDLNATQSLGDILLGGVY